ncbi:MAG TPA: hypothetical protein VNU68_05040 [Verrucomicrobiae bacterium]|nr:hypothetical protein [Verrucomicrobiae bacterium]
MNAQRFLASTAVVAGVVLATVVLLRTPQTPLRVGSPDPVELPPLSAQPSENVGAADLARTATTSAGVMPAKPVKPVLSAATRVHTVLFEDAAQPAQMLRVPAASPLAKVNDVIITLKDLVPGESAEKLMSSEMYHSLLDQAIERELTFQAARAKGIELSEEQQQQREQVRAALLARHSQGDGKVAHLNLSGTIQDQIQFELRDATSQLLLSSLLAMAGAPSPYVTEGQVQEYYLSHLDLYGALPATEAQRASTWQRIDYEIRQKLAPTVQTEYAEGVRQYLEQLKAKAKVTL